MALARAIAPDFEIWFTASRYEKSNALVADAGFSLLQCDSIDADTMVEESADAGHSWTSRENLAPIFQDQLRAVRALRPAFIVNDFSLPMKMVATVTETPCLAIVLGHLCPYYGILRKPPPQHAGVRMLRSLRIPQAMITQASRLVAPHIYRHMVRGINEIRREQGLACSRSYFHELVGDHNLISDLPEVAPMQKLPENYEYIGPIFNADDGNEDELLARLDPGKATIICTLGTRKLHNQRGIHELLNHPGFRVYNVIIAGPDPEDVLDPAIITKPFIHFGPVLPRCDVAIIHGGDATLYQCIQAGVAILGMPGHPEQVWSVQRAARLGLGEELAPDVAADTLLARVQYWLELRGRHRARFTYFATQVDLAETQRKFRAAVLRFVPRFTGFPLPRE